MGTPLLVATFSQFATHMSDTASGLAFAYLYAFSSADMFPEREHLCSLLHYLNFLHTGASCSLASLNCDFSASLRYHSFVCSFRITHFNIKKAATSISTHNCLINFIHRKNSKCECLYSFSTQRCSYGTTLLVDKFSLFSPSKA